MMFGCVGALGSAKGEVPEKKRNPFPEVDFREVSGIFGKKATFCGHF